MQAASVRPERGCALAAENHCLGRYLDVLERYRTSGATGLAGKVFCRELLRGSLQGESHWQSRDRSREGPPKDKTAFVGGSRQ